MRRAVNRRSGCGRGEGNRQAEIWDEMRRKKNAKKKCERWDKYGCMRDKRQRKIL